MRITCIGRACFFIDASEGRIVTVEEFEGLMDNVHRAGASTVEAARGSLPERREVWILDCTCAGKHEIFCLEAKAGGYRGRDSGLD